MTSCHTKSVELIKVLSSSISALSKNLLDGDEDKYNKIVNNLMKHLTPTAPRKKRKRTVEAPEQHQDTSVSTSVDTSVVEMTHRDSCAAVGLQPTPRGINILPGGKELFIQCQTREPTVYDDILQKDFFYDFAASRGGKRMKTIDDLKPGTVNRAVYELFNKQGGVQIIAAFGGRNKWHHESFYVSGFKMVDGFLKIVCSGLKVPRPLLCNE
jgi:hypothetical protein